jgi:hypothetical protein
MKMTYKIILTVLVVAVSAALSAGYAAESIVGTWRLISQTAEDSESKAIENVFGDKPVGFLTYTSDGRMSVIITRSTRKLPASAKATEAEAAHLYGTMIAYAGTYRIDGDKNIHHVEVSWNEAWNGTDQERFAEVRDYRLTLYSPPFVSPTTGRRIDSKLVFERIP